MNISDIIRKYKEGSEIRALLHALGAGQTKLALKGLIGSADAFVSAAVYDLIKRSFVFVLSDHEEASFFLADLEHILHTPVYFFPASYRKAFDFTQIDTDNALRRAEALNKISKSTTSPFIIVTYPEALAEKVVHFEELKKNVLELRQGDEMSMELIIEFLIEAGFNRVDFVYEPGQFAVRGGIVDIFSFADELPFRLEFAGEEIESIRRFEVDTQLSVAQMRVITILPDMRLDSFVKHNVSLFEYMNDDAICWIKDIQLTLDRTKEGNKRAMDLWNALSELDKGNNPSWIDPEFAFISDHFIAKALQDLTVVEYGKQFYYKSSKVIKFHQRPQPSFNKDFNLLIHHLEKSKTDGIETLIFSDSPKQIDRLFAILDDIGTPATFTPVHAAIRQGFSDEDLKVAFYTDHQIFDRYYKYKLRRGYSRSQSLTLKELRELKPGDFITHIDHGIGKYAGLEKVEINGKTQETIRLVYADDDLLYVNINSLNRISKYSGKEGAIPKLHKLGTDTWEKLKRNTKKKVKDIARDLIKLYAQRKAQAGNAFSPDTYLQNELEASFIFEDTPDQEKATADLKKDMEQPIPMDRLVCGDVGFGKTEVAIRGAFKAVTDGKQVAVLVPTTILALQHYNTFVERLNGFPVEVDYINRFKTAKQIKDTLNRLSNGKIDIIIGTHRLVSKDVKFKDLGLLIIDEEQKFGVKVKEKLKHLRANVDTLTLTATPIPRTLHFSLMGARDLSIISTPPPNRQPVQTELHIFNESLIKEAVEYELHREGQVFFIHNRIHDLEQLGGMVKRLVPHARVGIAHGQLSGEQLEDVMLRFINHEYDVLMATTIIEAGLDIPNTNTIIINHAHMFGLSDLHQMRGRVGRSNKKAFCYLLSPPLSTLTSEARKRLSAIEEFSDLGSGFNVAMRDLDIRGSGNLLGAEQSGFIAEIGFEMYHKILDEAIQELKDEEFSDLFTDVVPKPFVSFTHVDTDQDVHIPDAYVTNVSERYNLYTELSKIENEEELEVFKKGLVDRFGPLPIEVFELFNTLRLQWIGKILGFEKISFKKNVLRGYFVSEKDSEYFQSGQFGAILQFVQDNSTICSLKEVRSTLRISIERVADIKHALSILGSITEVPIERK